jgi:hypothetical protein
MKELLSSTAFIVVNKTLAKNLGLKETVLLADLISKEEYFIDNGMTDGWFFNTETNIQKDTYFKINEEQVVKFLNNKSLSKSTTINNNKEIILNNKLSIKEKFENLVMFFDYPKEMKQDFINYWTESSNRPNSKMRYEKQKTFDVKLRLSRWAKNSAKWDKPKKAGTSKLDAQIDEWQKAKSLL